MVGEERLAVDIGPEGDGGGDGQLFRAKDPDGRALQVAAVLYGKDGPGHPQFAQAVDQVDLHDPVIQDTAGGYVVTAAIVAAVGRDDRGEGLVKRVSFAFDLQPPALFVAEKMVDDSGIEAHGPGDQAVVDPGVVIGDIRVDPEAGDIDTIAVVDPDEIDVVDAVRQMIHAGAGKVVACAGRDEGQDVFRSGKVIQQPVDRTVASDGRDHVFAVLIALDRGGRVADGLIEYDLIVPVKMLRCLF